MFKMQDRKQISLLYTGLLAVSGVAILSFLSLHTGMRISHAPAFIGFVLFGVAVSSFGFPAPHVGYVSLDRVVQFASILIFGTLQAAWIVGIAAFIWPLLPWGNARNDMRLMFIRALHNSGMMVIVILVTGGLYQSLGGDVPLLQLNIRNVLLIIVLAPVMQLLNSLFLAVIAWLENYDWHKAFGFYAAVVDLAAIPIAVLTALVYNRLDLHTFVLFMIVLALIVLIVKRLADTRRALENKVDELVAVNRVGKAVSSSLVLDELLELIFRECRSLVVFDTFMLALYDDSSREIDIRLHHNPQGRQPQRRQSLGVGIMGWVVSHNQPAFIRNWQQEASEFKRIIINIGDTPQTQSLIAVPMAYRDRVLGVLSVQSYTGNMFSESHVNLLMTFASQAAIAIANARLFEELEHSRSELELRVSARTRDLAEQKDELHALTESLRNTNREKEELLLRLQRQTLEDGLTGLYNRRYLDSRLGLEVSRAERYKRDLAVVMGDIDHFKVVNDRFSHMVGDDVLRVMANILRAQCRSIDIIARYGGEEFLLCFPETSRENAAAVCEKIRRQVEAYEWQRLEQGLKVTISFGVAAAPPGYTVDALIAAADEKLYEAKHSGRNRVCY
ncbi:MAG: diguanylate cyclase [Gammaproteobacteria bacterium]|nr:diguanylate cyclase [Gammaproteobacteria bacterium]MDE2345737.1 diguanylate cyclase [Gammaproteobacteria bacterium]